MKSPATLSALAISLAAATSAAGQLWKGEVGNIEALEKGAAAGDAGQTAEYAWHLLEGQGGRRYDAKQIFKHFESAAAEGSALGQVGLSRCYCHGIGTPANMRLSWRYAEEAAKTHHPEAWKQMGYLLWSGYGVPQDKKRAMGFTVKAAAAGSVGAKVNRILEAGTPPEFEDHYSAYADIAFRTGHLLGAANAAFGYVFKRGVPEEYDSNRKLIALLEDRAKLEHPDALRGLAFIRGCQGDWEGEQSLVLRAAATGVGPGIHTLMKELNLSYEPKYNQTIARYSTTAPDRNALNWWFYSLGKRDEVNVMLAAQALAEGFESKAADPAAAAKLVAKYLPGEDKHMHFHLANVSRFLIAPDKSGKVGKLAIAHATYACDKDPRAFGLLAFLLSGKQPGIAADLPRAWAAMERAPKEDPYRAWGAKMIEDQLDQEQKEAADALTKKGYPDAAPFIAEAATLLKEAGELEGTYD